MMMEFLVQFEVDIPDGVAASEVEDRQRAEAAAAETLAAEGHLVRVWQVSDGTNRTTVLGLYRAGSRTELDGLLSNLPLYEWMRTSITPLVQHPNDPGRIRTDPVNDSVTASCTTTANGPETGVHYEQATSRTTPDEDPPFGGEPGGGTRCRDSGAGATPNRPLTGGTFVGPELNGTLLPGASADWQIVLPDGSALGDVRFTLRTDDGDLLYVRSHGVRHGGAEVLAPLSRGEEVDASEYVFRTSTQIETAAPHLDWLNKGVFISVGGRQLGGVIYEVYLVG